MEESKELKNLYTFLQGAVYLTIFIELFILFGSSWSLVQTNEKVQLLFLKIRHLPIYQNILYSKCFTLLLIIVVSIGTKARKNTALKLWQHILFPFCVGLVVFFDSLFLLLLQSKWVVFWHLTVPQISYGLLSIVGAVMIQIGLDNCSKYIKSNLMQDRFNIENESFEQTKEKMDTPQSVNIPMQFYNNRLSIS